ncbi:MAG: phosphomannomutase/phosphoglucomutase [Acidobacteriota bacterium]
MAGIFKAYDVRGTYPDQIDEEIVRKIGRSFALLLDQQTGTDSRKVVVGHDMRSHSAPLCEALLDGLHTSGIDTLEIGLTTTPMNYFAVGKLQAAGGIQVTASHNPARYNGLKFSLHEARPVSGDDGIPLMEQAATSGDLPTSDRRGTSEKVNLFEDYGQHVLGHLLEGRRLKVAVDAANGMGTIYKPLLERAGIDLIPLYFELDGNFPNHEANPLKLENLEDLSALVRSEQADLGVCFDGDADRAAFVDETGAPIGSDLVTALIGGEIVAENPGKAVVYDVRSSRAVAEYLTEKGGDPRKERVGHSFIKATMRKLGGVFGGELAGHYYFRENFYADCSLLAVVEVINLLRKKNQTMSEIVAPLARYATSPEINFEVEDKQGMMAQLGERYSDGEISHLDGISVDFPDWWFNVRPSNTEPLLRLVLEANTPELLAEKQTELTEMLGTPI